MAVKAGRRPELKGPERRAATKASAAAASREEGRVAPGVTDTPREPLPPGDAASEASSVIPAESGSPAVHVFFHPSFGV